MSVQKIENSQFSIFRTVLSLWEKEKGRKYQAKVHRHLREAENDCWLKSHYFSS